MLPNGRKERQFYRNTQVGFSVQCSMSASLLAGETSPRAGRTLGISLSFDLQGVSVSQAKQGELCTPFLKSEITIYHRLSIRAIRIFALPVFVLYALHVLFPMRGASFLSSYVVRRDAHYAGRNKITTYN